jgi:hypothetical protein
VADVAPVPAMSQQLALSSACAHRVCGVYGACALECSQGTRGVHSQCLPSILFQRVCTAQGVHMEDGTRVCMWVARPPRLWPIVG